MKEKYLFYDALVRGAGLGHTMCRYIYGLELAQKKKMIYMPDIIRAGHGFHTLELGTIESFLGLPDYRQKRLDIKKDSGLILNIPYQHELANASIEIFNFSSESKAFLKDCFQNKRRLLFDNLFATDIINIAISIRRGDIVSPENKTGSHKNRLKNEQYYIDIAKAVVNENKLKNYHIHIYSDGARHQTDQYVDINNNILDIKQLFLNHFNSVSVYIANHKPKETMSHFQHCVDADYFIGSISGFSQLISIFRKKNTTYLPLHKESNGQKHKRI